MRMVSTARDLEYKRLRASWLSEGFKHWRKLASLGYPNRRAPKFIKGLKEAAEAVSLRRKYFDIVLAAKADMFRDAFRAEEQERSLEEANEVDQLTSSMLTKGDYRLLDKLRLIVVGKYLSLDYGKAADDDYVYELRPPETQFALDYIVSRSR